MRKPDSLNRDFKRLEREPDKHARGRQFEELVQRLLVRSHYLVQRGGRVAWPRQTDLFATKDSDDYVIETKWQEDRANIDDLDNLRSRLNRGPAHLVGLLLSMSGFTEEMIADLEAHRQRIILLFDDEEIRGLFHGTLDFESLVREKRGHFVGGRVFFHCGPSLWSNQPVPDRTMLVPPDLRIVVPGIGTVPWVAGAGGFGPVIFAQELPDVDFIPAQGFGVGFDLNLRSVTARQDLAYVMDTLRNIGWVSDLGRYSIQQSKICWYGTGAAGFLDAVDAWESRYEKVTSRIHHTEEATYFDVFDHGFFTFTVDFSHGIDRVFPVKISAQLYGIPFDVEPFRMLTSTFSRDDFAYFRPLANRMIHTQHWSWNDHRLESVAFLCADNEWIEGIVVRNPFYRTGESDSKQYLDLDQKLHPLKGHELLCCSLSSAHELGDEVDFYFLRHAEMTRTDNATVFHITADWNDLLVRKHPITATGVVTVKELRKIWTSEEP